MNISCAPVSRVLLAFAVVVGAGMAQARNTQYMMPIDAAMRSPGTRALLGQDVSLRFGKASAAGLEIINTRIEVHEVVDPFGGSGNNNGGRRDRLSDEQVCLNAFRKAVVELQHRARSSGAGAVVGIVSNYNHVEFDSPETYECHVGMTRGVVDLMGQTARSAGAVQIARAQPRQASALQMPVSQPGAAAAPMAPAESIPLIASGFANIADVDAIPYLSDKGREAYRAYLARPTPKAFAISSAGHWFNAWTLVPGEASLPTDPVERAVVGCNRTSPTPCKLYAVNGAVVWTGTSPISAQEKK